METDEDGRSWTPPSVSLDARVIGRERAKPQPALAPALASCTSARTAPALIEQGVGLCFTKNAGI